MSCDVVEGVDMEASVLLIVLVGYWERMANCKSVTLGLWIFANAVRGLSTSEPSEAIRYVLYQDPRLKVLAHLRY